MTLRARLALGILLIGAILLAPLLITRRALERLDSLTSALRSYDFAASLVPPRLSTLYVATVTCFASPLSAVASGGVDPEMIE